jgi:chromosome segregation ATPase
MGTWIFMGCLMSALGTGCVAQQADLARIQKDLEQQMGQLKSEKAALGRQVEEARLAITESQDLISTQKADMAKMRSDLAPLNQQVKLMREQDLTSVYGQFEMSEKKMSDLRQDLTNLKEKLSGDILALQTSTQSQDKEQQRTDAQITALTQQVDEKNQVLTDKMTEFQTAFGQFKESLGSLGKDLSKTQTDIGTIKADLTAQDQVLQIFKSDLTTQDQALRAFLEQNVKTAMNQLVADMDARQRPVLERIDALQSDMESRQRPVLERIDALQSDMEALGTHVQADATQVQDLLQSVVKLREAQDVMGSLLGKRGDEIIQQAGRLSERMNTVESHQATLTQELQSNTKKTSTHLTEVNASLTALSQNLGQTTQSLSQRLGQQEQTMASLDKAMQELQQLKGETQGQIQQMRAASQVSAQLKQNVEQMTKRMQELEIHQSALVGKLDSDAQTTTSHLQEVNNGIKSVAQALENVSAKLNARIVNQEQQLNHAITKFQSVQNTAESSQTNIQHLNDLTGTMNQLQGVINTIGTKLGERVDEHEDRLSQLAKRVNQLQGTNPKKMTVK